MSVKKTGKKEDEGEESEEGEESLLPRVSASRVSPLVSPALFSPLCSPLPDRK